MGPLKTMIFIFMYQHRKIPETYMKSPGDITVYSIIPLFWLKIPEIYNFLM